MESQKVLQSGVEEHKIKIADVIHFCQKYLLKIIFIAICFTFIGYGLSYLLTKKYVAKTLVLPEYSMGGNSFFSTMNSQISEGAEKLTPDLYPTVLKSSNFGIYLLKQPILDKDNISHSTLEAYLTKKSDPGLLAKIKNSLFSSKPTVAPVKTNLKNENILSLSPSEVNLIKYASSLVYVTVEKKDGVIKIESEMADPVIASQIVEFGRNYLVNYVEDYRSAKTNATAKFLEERVKEARKRQQSAEYALQSYRDHNRGTYMNVARIEEQRLQTDYTLAQSVYSDMVMRLEQAKIKVKQEKPVFKVLEPVSIPFSPSSPRRLIMALIFGFLGGFGALSYILFVKEKVYRQFI
jgi:uncharacterized protein involved in exopolysaccharide biosynthesis